MKKKLLIVLCCELALFFMLFFILDLSIEAKDFDSWGEKFLLVDTSEDQSNTLINKKIGQGDQKAETITDGEDGFMNQPAIAVMNSVLSNDLWKEIKNENSVIETASKTESENTENDKIVEIVAFGDNLIHTSLIDGGKQKDGTYDFSHMFSNVREEIGEADVAIINQETILSTAELGYSGYPRFGTPNAMGQAIVDAGFDVVLHATNHALDKGVKGIQNTMYYWKNQKDITMVGLSKSEKSSSRVAIVEVEDIKIAILNYTYGLNGLTLPKGQEYLVNMLNNKEQIKKDIAFAKKKADFIIVCPHWGTEYSYEANKSQLDWVQFFFEQEVDLVLGTHPHVLQPVEQIESDDTDHKMLVYYSLGNFISGQDQVPRLLGGMARINIAKYGDRVEIVDSELVPIVTHYNRADNIYTTYFLSEYNEELAKDHSIKEKTKKILTVAELEKLYENIVEESN